MKFKKTGLIQLLNLYIKLKNDSASYSFWWKWNKALVTIKKTPSKTVYQLDKRNYALPGYYS